MVNDASTDGTDDLIKKYIAKADFPIQYHVNDKNRMKTYCIDKATGKAHGELFIIADCDDEFVNDALEIFLKTWESFPEKTRENFSGVVCNTKDQYGNFIGTPFPQSPWISDVFEMRYKYKIKGEKSGFENVARENEVKYL